MGDRKWFSDHLPADGSAQLYDATSTWCTVGIWGPRARDVVAVGRPRTTSRTRASRSGRAGRSSSAASRSLASRISYVGELGWELYVPMEQGARLWDTLWEAGQPHGIVPFGIGVYGTTGRLEKGYRAHGAELELEFDLVEAGMLRPKVKEADFIGRAAYLEQRSRPPVATLCTLTVDDNTSASGVKRYMLGREPILTADGGPITDAKGRRSFVTSAGSGPSVGKHILLSYLPPEHAVAGTKLARRVLRRALPGHRRGRRLDAAVRPRERAGPGLTMNILVCVKRVPATGRQDHPDRRRAGDRHALPRLHGQPARGMRGRGGGPARRGARRDEHGPDPRPGGGGRPAPRGDGDRHRPGDPARDRRRRVGRRSTTAAAIVDAIRAREAADGPFDLILLGNEAADTGDYQVGVRVARRARPAVRDRASRGSRSATTRSSPGARRPAAAGRSTRSRGRRS